MLDMQKLNLDLNLIRTLKGMLSLVVDPEDTNSVFDVEDSLRQTEAAKLAVEHVKQQEGVAALFQPAYYLPAPPDIDDLLSKPEDSLGYAYGSYLQENHLKLDFYRPIAVEDDITYMFMRMRQTHDIWHVVTGFGTSVAEELGLKAFEIAQVHRTLSALLVCGGIIKTLLSNPEDLDELLEKVAIGYRMGKKAKPLFAQKWEEHWDKPLAEWRKDLNLELIPTYVP